MRFMPLLLAGALLSAGTAMAARSADPEAKIAKALAGRVPGEPVDCINLRDIRSSRIIDRTAILYETNGGRYYLNRPESGANFLGWDDILVTDTHSSQLCSIDIVRLVDRGSRFPSGSVGLGKFVPYTKPGKAKSW
ncbi:hypothetical protein [Sphingomonas profundi]|uniref:hypothetical protein n=1 Tax=Alterirhizorhabdus profundi TaxID=2681549 RepID=UPI0012E6FE6E|nr:hypothetical protein [Sphingomonas profundi]